MPVIKTEVPCTDCDASNDVPAVDYIGDKVPSSALQVSTNKFTSATSEFTVPEWEVPIADLSRCFVDDSKWSKSISELLRVNCELSEEVKVPPVSSSKLPLYEVEVPESVSKLFDGINMDTLEIEVPVFSAPVPAIKSEIPDCAAEEVPNSVQNQEVRVSPSAHQCSDLQQVTTVKREVPGSQLEVPEVDLPYIELEVKELKFLIMIMF